MVCWAQALQCYSSLQKVALVNGDPLIYSGWCYRCIDFRYALYSFYFWVLFRWHRERQFWLIAKAMTAVVQYKGCKRRMPPIVQLENSPPISCRYPDFTTLTSQHLVFAAFGVSFIFRLPFSWQRWWFQCYFKCYTQFRSLTRLWNSKILNSLSTKT